MRLTNRVVSVLLALAIIVAGLVVPVEIVRGALSKPHWLLPWEAATSNLRRDSWQSGPVRSILIVAVAVGLLLLVAQLKPRRPSAIPLAPLTPQVEASTTRRSLQSTLQHAAADVDGISSAKAVVRRQSAKVTAVSHLRDSAGIEAEVRERVGRRLDALGLAHAPRLTVQVRPEGKR